MLSCCCSSVVYLKMSSKKLIFSAFFFVFFHSIFSGPVPSIHLSSLWCDSCVLTKKQPIGRVCAVILDSFHLVVAPPHSLWTWFVGDASLRCCFLMANMKIYTITVLNSSSTDQWLRKEISNAADQTNGLDINLDTILSNYQFVKTECFAYDDSGFATAESTKDDINYSSSSASHQQQQQHPPPTSHVSTGVTTTSPNVLLDASMNGTNDMISYTDMTNNNNEWNIDRNGIKEWETCEANVSTFL